MNLYESLYIISSTIQSNYHLFQIIKDNKYHEISKASELEPKALSHYLTLHFFIILNTVSILEEYDRYFFSKAEDEFKDRIIQVRTILKPVYQRIRKWKDLDTVRHELIAHTKRVGSGGVTSYTKLWTYDAPRGFVDISVLMKCLGAMAGVIEKEFAVEIANMRGYMRSILQGAEQVESVSELKSELFQIANDVNALCKKYEKPYQLNTTEFVQ